MIIAPVLFQNRLLFHALPFPARSPILTLGKSTLSWLSTTAHPILRNVKPYDDIYYPSNLKKKILFCPAALGSKIAQPFVRNSLHHAPKEARPLYCLTSQNDSKNDGDHNGRGFVYIVSSLRKISFFFFEYSVGISAMESTNLLAQFLGRVHLLLLFLSCFL